MDAQISSESNANRNWSIGCSKVPREEIIFFTQVILIYIVVIACVVNLSFTDNNTSLWSSLLSGCLGYLLPSPKLRKKNVQLLPNAA